MAEITQTISSSPSAPNRTKPETFAADSDTFNAHIEGLDSELNSFASQANALADFVNGKSDAAVSAANADLWASGVTYADGDAAIRNGEVYLSVQGSNTGNDPATDDGTWWNRITPVNLTRVGQIIYAPDVGSPAFESLFLKLDGSTVAKTDWPDLTDFVETNSVSRFLPEAGSNWVESSDSGTVTTETLQDAAHNGTVWVAVGGSTSSVMVRSTDGQSWTAATDSGSFSQVVNAVTAINGTFVAVGTNGLIITSTNGDSWSEPADSQSLTTESLNDITHDGSRLVAVGAGATVIYSDDDGATWTSSSGISSINVNFGGSGITHSGTIFLTLDNNGRLFESTDGNNWSTASGSESSVFTNTTPITIGTDGTGFVITGRDGNSDLLILTDPEGDTTFTTATDSAFIANHDGRAVIYAEGAWYIVGLNGIIITSTDGDSWTELADSQSVTTADLFGIGHKTGAFVACGGNGTLLSSISDDTVIVLSDTTADGFPAYIRAAV